MSEAVSQKEIECLYSYMGNGNICEDLLDCRSCVKLSRKNYRERFPGTDAGKCSIGANGRLHYPPQSIYLQEIFEKKKGLHQGSEAGAVYQHLCGSQRQKGPVRPQRGRGIDGYRR